jgi:hypothetical protein
MTITVIKEIPGPDYGTKTTVRVPVSNWEHLSPQKRYEPRTFGYGKRGGNWCGWGHTADGPPVDRIDELCREHDLAYARADQLSAGQTDQWPHDRELRRILQLLQTEDADRARALLLYAADRILIQEVETILYTPAPTINLIRECDLEGIISMKDDLYLAMGYHTPVRPPVDWERYIIRFRPYPFEPEDEAAQVRERRRSLLSDGHTYAQDNGLLG